MIGATLDRIDGMFDRRFASRPSWVVLAELFLGIGWLRSAVAKIIEPEWWSGQVITDFVTDHEPQTIGWYQPVVDLLIADVSVGWAFVVLVLEVVAAMALLTSRRLGAGLAIAIFLNVNFVLIGATNPSIFYLVLQLGLVLWLVETAKNLAGSIRLLRRLGLGALVFTIACLPYVQTVDPTNVIEDPASVLVTWSLCGTIAAAGAHRRLRRQVLRAAWVEGTNEPVRV